MNRRGFITGLISLVAAPAIVRAGSLMPIKAEIIKPLRQFVVTGIDDYMQLAPCTPIDVLYGTIKIKNCWDVKLGDIVTFASER